MSYSQTTALFVEFSMITIITFDSVVTHFTWTQPIVWNNVIRITIIHLCNINEMVEVDCKEKANQTQCNKMSNTVKLQHCTTQHWVYQNRRNQKCINIVKTRLSSQTLTSNLLMKCTAQRICLTKYWLSTLDSTLWSCFQSHCREHWLSTLLRQFKSTSKFWLKRVNSIRQWWLQNTQISPTKANARSSKKLENCKTKRISEQSKKW
jgi:hypothetical protein